jgi:hypothetical protein
VQIGGLQGVETFLRAAGPAAKRSGGCELRGHVGRQLVQLLDRDHHALRLAVTRRKVLHLHVVTGGLEILHLCRQDIELTGTLDAGVPADDEATELLFLALGPGEIGSRDLDDCYCNRLPSNRGNRGIIKAIIRAQRKCLTYPSICVNPPKRALCRRR